MIREAIRNVVDGVSLSRGRTEDVFAEIMRGAASPSQIAALITALRIKGETLEEICGAAAAMRKFSEKITVSRGPVLDTCGTGGDGAQTFNISTLAALIAAGAGVIVAKHGNRSVSSKSGSADLLEKLGINLNAEPAITEKCVNELGIGFLFAPKLHPAMRFAAEPRRDIGIRTIFNVLGPLTNPAQATHQLLGVFSESLVEPLATVLGNLGSVHAVVVHGDDGLDEVTLTAPTLVGEYRNGQVRTYRLSPEQFGFRRVTSETLRGGDPAANAATAREILAGAPGPLRDVVLLNAAVAIYAADAAPSIELALPLARQSLEQGAALAKLTALVECSHGFAA